MIRGGWAAGAAGVLAVALSVPAVTGASDAASAPPDRGQAVAVQAGSPPGYRVVAVGDIAAADNADAPVAQRVAALNPQLLLLVGDVAYPKGSRSDFAKYFNPDWRRFAAIWAAVPGNHEYKTPGAAGFREYFGKTGALYWARRAGSWVVIGLDSERPNSQAQQTWLRRTLKRYNGVPTLVTWHTARFSSGYHGDQPQVNPLWQVIRADRDVRLVVWGHDHDYERMSVPVPGRTPVTALVVGTGGGEQRPTPTLKNRPWRAFYVDQVYGVLELGLTATGFGWRYVTETGQVLDSGTARLR